MAMAMARNNVSICHTCGQRLVDYKHSINRTLVSCLWRLYQAGGCARLDKLGLYNTQFTNFQKLRYFNLAVATGRYSEWQITQAGVEFLQGRRQMPRFVITRNARIKQISDELLFVQQVKDCVEFKVEWQAQAGQPTLFDNGGDE